jgi:hypothetical protein
MTPCTGCVGVANENVGAAVTPAIGGPSSLFREICALRAKKRCGDYSDSVGSAVCRGSRGDDYGVQQPVADFRLKPLEVAQVSFFWHLREFYFYREYSTAALEDEVDFVVASVCAQVTDLRLGGLCVYPDGLGH